MIPKISIIIPVYNNEKYISACLKSVLRQTYSNIEIIIVNDGSTDNSENIINEFMGKDNRIVYFHQKNSGPSEARNKAILNAKGKYLVFVDSDDTVEKEYIQSLYDTLIISNYDLVCCGYNDFSVYGVQKIFDFKDVSMNSLLEKVCKGTGGVLWGKMFKTEIIIKNNILMDLQVYMSEDLLFVMQYLMHCNSCAGVREYLYNYNRLNLNSISSNNSIEYIHNHIAVCKKMENLMSLMQITKYRIHEIIKERIQQIVIFIIEHESEKIDSNNDKKSLMNNIKEVLFLKYVQHYKPNFSTKTVVYIPTVFFIKNNMIKSVIYYSTLLNKLKSIKKFLKRGSILTHEEKATICH